MSNSNRFAEWATRQVSQGKAKPLASSGPTPGVAQSNSPTLPPAPPGYAWSTHPQAGFILVQLGGGNPQAMPAPIRQPQHFTAQPVAPVLQLVQPVETCTLVKKGNVDTYAQLLASVPELPVQGDPVQMQAELSGLLEFQQVQEGGDPRSFPQSGKGVPSAVVAELKPAG